MADESTKLLSAWQHMRAAVHAHTAATTANGERTTDRFAGLGLPTHSPMREAQRAWLAAVADYRQGHLLPGTKGAAYAARLADGHAYEAMCSTHPGFRRVAWTRPATPLRAAWRHNAEHHGGARAVILPGPGNRTPSTLLPAEERP